MGLNKIKIDIVVPVYNAYTCVKECLTSLEKNQRIANKVYIINDCSTDERIMPLLGQYAIKNKWELLNQPVNQGFVKTANYGLKLSKNHTILLNSDAIVTDKWLHGFKACVENINNLATATAWSNNAEICSFPQFLKNNELPQNLDEFSQNLFNKYRPVYPDIPTAVGFCMLITKQAKELIGYFDEKQFGHGYGEENDYSLRALNENLRNVVCDNVYVAHVGNQSFSDLGIKPDENSMKRLLEKHPNYLEIIHDFINQDPLASVRETILNKIE